MALAKGLERPATSPAKPGVHQLDDLGREFFRRIRARPTGGCRREAGELLKRVEWDRQQFAGPHERHPMTCPGRLHSFFGAGIELLPCSMHATARMIALVTQALVLEVPLPKGSFDV